MPFDQTTILEVYPPTRVFGGWKISWVTASPGLVSQVYVNKKLSYHGYATEFVLATSSSKSRIDIGTVDVGEDTTDFSSDLDPAPETRVTFSWLGGLWEASDLSGFRIYGESTPGSGISYLLPLGDIQAYPEGLETDGFGMGGFGSGGFGSASALYTWTSEPLRVSGIWNYAIVPYDKLGNEGAAALVSQAVTVAPGPPSRLGTGDRMDYSYSPTTHKATLTWGASES